MPRTSPLVKVVGLDHIVFRCADIERSLAFYADTLGLVPERVSEWRAGEAPFPSVRITPTTIIAMPMPSRVLVGCLKMNAEIACANSTSTSASVRTLAAVASAKARN